MGVIQNSGYCTTETPIATKEINDSTCQSTSDSPEAKRVLLKMNSLSKKCVTDEETITLGASWQMQQREELTPRNGNNITI